MKNQEKLSAIILTYNEEKNLPQCLESIRGLAHETIVVDSFSTDRTQAIAKEFGARVHEHPFKNQADQFNWALDNLEITGDWILKLDADEYVTPELRGEIHALLNADERAGSPTAAFDGYYIKRRVYFMGRWIRHGGYYPIWFLRLWRKGKGRSEVKEMDEHIVLTEGKAGRLRYDFADDNRKGLSDWTAKHNNYATREAWDYVAGLYASGDKKAFYYRLPPFCRAFAYFSYRYFIRLGFLDGAPGLAWHFLQGLWYRFLIDAKIRELQNESSHRH
ncbi:glycosyltransferase family 2 protein [Patescibacteria group bacterium]|nr:glycosyltransferase family 2 protein [Patescibacteria group bacterium]